MSDTRILVLAAGKGKRMRADIPKPLVEIAGRPMVDHLLDSIHASEIDETPVLIVAPDSVEHFRNLCSEQRCEFALQQEQLGTGHAVSSAEDIARDAKTVIVLYGDHPFISSELMRSLKHMHDEQGAVISMITTEVPSFDGDYEGFKNWGRIIRDDAGRIIAIREAKDASNDEREIKEVNPSLFAFDGEWLWEHLPTIQNKNASGEYYLTDLVAMAIEEGEDVASTTAKPMEVIGVNTPEELARAEEFFG
ncbi:MAG: NTP transferase domain-containing protein [bacterium]|nr:NTP transferase domain-containing protein [bacterium]MDA1024769.1 NTP transferase domain-containing protein [bacterium]